jgi:hypothetical protein
LYEASFRTKPEALKVRTCDKENDGLKTRERRVQEVIVQDGRLPKEMWFTPEEFEVYHVTRALLNSYQAQTNNPNVTKKNQRRRKRGVQPREKETEDVCCA